MQPSVDDTAQSAGKMSTQHTGIRAVADKFMSSGTLFSPIGAVAATTGSAVANSMVREAVMGVHMESAYLNGMVQNFSGRAAGFGNAMGGAGIQSVGRGARTMSGTFGHTGVLANSSR
ncbi:MAG: hypothetical protein H7338_23585, partial [Candidatus Sericytochromatia bacterium]|nr:hypothetical protein [Candidatus Sericytochromatia bacterium]